jgi:glyoxylase-like metal-dependent hydrolase (beta-lactamase superfamily II)
MGVNCYLVIDQPTRKALLVDPGDDAELILDWCQSLQVTVSLILITHAHLDHIGANEKVHEVLSAPLAILPGDAAALTDPEKNLSVFFDPIVSPAADILLEADTDLTWDGPSVRVLETPGHSPGSACFLGEGWIISGDVLFRESIGRTDFPGCSAAALMRSIRQKLMVLPDQTVVYPGHGDPTTIGHERKYNPFL